MKPRKPMNRDTGGIRSSSRTQGKIIKYKEDLNDDEDSESENESNRPIKRIKHKSLPSHSELPEGLQVPSSVQAVDDMDNEELYMFCKFQDSTKNDSPIICLICSRALEAYGNIGKFRKHLKTHIYRKDQTDIIPSSTLPEGTKRRHVEAMRNNKLRKYYTLEKDNVASCNICGKKLASFRDIGKFRKHLMSHASDTKSWTATTFPVPEGMIPTKVDTMTTQGLMKHCTIQPNGKILCHICKFKLVAYGKVRKFRRHLRYHAVASLKSKSDEHSGTNLNGSIAVAIPGVNQMTNDQLKKYCTMKPDGIIICKICNMKLNAHGNIRKFRRHLRNHPASQTTLELEEEEENDE